jgi:hypothetical protein
MQAGMMGVSVAAFLLMGFAVVGGPAMLVDWSRKRRQTTIARQIALTDALDGRLGAIVAPLVKKPLWGPWEVEIAVPFSAFATVGRIVAIVDEVLSDEEGMRDASHRVVLRAKPGSFRETRKSRARRSATPWIDNAIGAA